MAKIDKADYQRRIERMSKIFADIAGQASELSRERCPYRDRHDICTAEFRCRNQKPETAAGIVCGHQGGFDYRDAWESDPLAWERAKKRIARNKERAETRRRARAERGADDTD